MTDPFIPNLHRQVWAIRDERVDAPAKQAPHVGLSVDGPHLHFQVPLVRVPHESRRDDAKASGALRDLVAVIPGTPHRPAHPGPAERALYFGPSCARRKRGLGIASGANRADAVARRADAVDGIGVRAVRAVRDAEPTL